ncbi:MAG: hypothetical protein JXQ27_06590 [Acidobacteria bacterium]|nr:hypothetical protein [Acidobacteriota bacterium]
MTTPPTDEKAWIVSVDMGYGHQRAAYPFRDMAHERIITANNDQIISPRERRYWENARGFYEGISRLKNLPLFGRRLFNLYDRLQSISPFFPFKDLSKPTLAALFLRRKIRKGLCASLVEYIRRPSLPILTTHFIPALAADYLGLENVFCVVTDTDINRVWVSAHPQKSRIIYLAPSRHAQTRLRQYGIPAERIVMTGFPLPDELTGDREGSLIKHDLGARLPQLDPKGAFAAKYLPILAATLGIDNVNLPVSRPLTITYMVGGAGAQREIGIGIVKVLREHLNRQEVRINLVAGIRMDVHNYFRSELADLGLADSVEIVYAPGKFKYFARMDEVLRVTDILWTKPSELTFYAALGLPIITSPPVGAHEKENQRWLQHVGAGFPQENLDYLNEWLFYVLDSGKFAEAAWDGHMNAPFLGTWRIRDILRGHS